MNGKKKGRKGSSKVKTDKVSNTISRVASNSASTSKKKKSSTSGISKSIEEEFDFDCIITVQDDIEEKLFLKSNRKKFLERRLQFLEAKLTKLRKRSRSTDSIEKKCLDEKPPKKLKEHTPKVHLPSTSQGKYKIFQAPFPDPHLEVSKGQKIDGPSRFWGNIEPYCADITQDNIRAIEEWIKTSRNYEKYLRIPELGQHFTLKWPLEDILEEVKEGSKSVENPKGLFTNSSEDLAEAERMKKLGESECSIEVDDQYAPMADRLVYSLVEENLMTANDDSLTESFNDDAAQNTKPSESQKPKETEVQDSSLEKRFYKDFYKAGLLDMEELESEAPEDEVCRELKRLQNALIPVQQHNLLQMKKLLCLAKAEMAKQEVKRKLREMDAKVMETYRIIATARKNKTMNKKLEDHTKRLLRERKKIVEKLENMT